MDHVARLALALDDHLFDLLCDLQQPSLRRRLADDVGVAAEARGDERGGHDVEHRGASADHFEIAPLGQLLDDQQGLDRLTDHEEVVDRREDPPMAFFVEVIGPGHRERLRDVAGILHQ